MSEQVDTKSNADRSLLPEILQKEYLFIIGSDRSGTTWLQSMIGAHPQVATTVQLTLFHSYVPAWLESWEHERGYVDDENQWDMGLPVVWSDEEFLEFLRDFVADVYSRVVAKKPGATHLLDKHPAYRNHVDDINHLIPHARFIHVVRDGRDVAVSMQAAKQSLGWGFSSVVEGAINWKEFVEQAQTAAKFDNRYLEVKYEDMSNDGAATLRRVYEFCDLAATDDEIADVVEQHGFEKMKSTSVSPDENRTAPAGHYRSGKAGAWKDAIKPLEQYFIDRYAGDVLQKLGYAEDGWWYSSQIQRATLWFRAAIHRVGRRLGRTWRVLLGGSE